MANKNFHFLIQERTKQQIGKKVHVIDKIVKDIPDCASFEEGKFNFPEVKICTSQLTEGELLDKTLAISIYETSFITKKGQ